MRPVTHRRRQQQAGFALLFIFVLAAGIAIAMLTQIPRVCFETQRDKEEVLIMRGEQYKRAIGMYVKKWNKWPAKLEDLENTNGIRYLRRRYVDPMTGKDEWRLIHAGPGGMLTDSLVKKQSSGLDGKTSAAGLATANMNASTNPGNTAGDDPSQPPEVNTAVKQRPSDRSMPGANPSQPVIPGQGPLTLPGQPPDLTANQQPYNPQQPYNQPGFNQAPGQLPPQQLGQQPSGQQMISQLGQQPVNYPAGGMQTQAPNPPNPSIPGNIAGTDAGKMLDNILRSPNPMGAAAMGGGGQNFGSGIAGVATTYKGPSIKVYDERHKYQEWEFVFDPRKDAAKAAGANPQPPGPSNPPAMRGTSDQPGPFQPVR